MERLRQRLMGKERMNGTKRHVLQESLGTFSMVNEGEQALISAQFHR